MLYMGVPIVRASVITVSHQINFFNLILFICIVCITINNTNYTKRKNYDY